MRQQSALEASETYGGKDEIAYLKDVAILPPYFSTN